MSARMPFSNCNAGASFPATLAASVVLRYVNAAVAQSAVATNPESADFISLEDSDRRNEDFEGELVTWLADLSCRGFGVYGEFLEEVARCLVGFGASSPGQGLEFEDVRPARDAGGFLSASARDLSVMLATSVANMYFSRGLRAQEACFGVALVAVTVVETPFLREPA